MFCTRPLSITLQDGGAWPPLHGIRGGHLRVRVNDREWSAESQAKRFFCYGIIPAMVDKVGGK